MNLAEAAQERNQNRLIRKVAVLGSGVMGSRIACHFANIGLKVLLLDIIPEEVRKTSKKGDAVRNGLVDGMLKSALQQNPSPVYSAATVNNIRTGNFDDDLQEIAACDWVLEAVVENAEIKKQLFEKVEALRKPGTLITSNTSGIPIHVLQEGRTDDFKKHFCGTHFFNPPRYLKLLEIIPGPETDPEVTGFLMDYGMRYLGKTTVQCKDTPAFIANRIGVFSIMAVMQAMDMLGLTTDAVDMLTGTISGRPKSATFRTADVVGIDTLAKVAENTYAAVPGDESREMFRLPPYITTMLEKNWLGDKTKQGFFKKIKNASGESEILTLDLKSLEYTPKNKVRFVTIEAAKQEDDLTKRLKILHAGNDDAGTFYRLVTYQVNRYISLRIPEIADHLYQIDEAMKAGFGWELGPFEIWDALGVSETVLRMQETGLAPAAWVSEMLAAGCSAFYRVENGRRKYYDITAKDYRNIPGSDNFLLLETLRGNKPVWQNAGATLHDTGDGILCLEFHTKLNVIGSEILDGVMRATSIAEQNYRGLIVGNDAANFSAGANLAMMLMLAIEQEYDELDMAVRMFQNAVARLRFCGIPVAVCPHGLTLGGGCEMTMHADVAVAASETYIGLVEAGAGLIPAGGGTKELALRAADSYIQGEIEIPALQKMSLQIAMAKVAGSAQEAFAMGLLRNGTDVEVTNHKRLLIEAKARLLEIADLGYTAVEPRSDIRVLGRSALGTFYAGIAAMRMGNYISAYDEKIAQKICYVLCGGDLSQPSAVSEQYLLDLEREAFLSLLGEQKTLARMQHILKTGKPLRN